LAAATRAGRVRRRHCRGISENASAFATENYTLDLGGEEQRAFEGNLGLTVKWCWQNVPMHGHSLPLAESPA
jgi:hypothetical protein